MKKQRKRLPVGALEFLEPRLVLSSPSTLTQDTNNLLTWAQQLSKAGMVTIPYLMIHSLAPANTPGSAHPGDYKQPNTVILNDPPAGKQAIFQRILQEVQTSPEIDAKLEQYVESLPRGTVIHNANLLGPNGFAFENPSSREGFDLTFGLHGLSELTVVSGTVNPDGSAHLVVTFTDTFDFDGRLFPDPVAYFNNEAYDLQQAGILHPFPIAGEFSLDVPPASDFPELLITATPPSSQQPQQESEAAQALYEYDVLDGAFSAKGPVGDSEVFAQGLENGTVTAATIDGAINQLVTSSNGKLSWATIPAAVDAALLQLADITDPGVGLFADIFGVGAEGALSALDLL